MSIEIFQWEKLIQERREFESINGEMRINMSTIVFFFLLSHREWDDMHTMHSYTHNNNQIVSETFGWSICFHCFHASFNNCSSQISSSRKELTQQKRVDKTRAYLARAIWKCRNAFNVNRMHSIQFQIFKNLYKNTAEREKQVKRHWMHRPSNTWDCLLLFAIYSQGAFDS